MTVSQQAPEMASLVVHGDDRPGIVAGISSVLHKYGANIVSLHQHSDNPEGGAFFQRLTFHAKHLAPLLPELEAELASTVGEQLGLSWRLRNLNVPLRVAILVSKDDHCLLDLLWRHRRHELPIDVSMVISNHPDSAEQVRGFNIPFLHVPSQPGSDKSASEARIIELVKSNVDLVVLARYMQILSDNFITGIGAPIINIHHSFLPAFIGAGPYRKAKERGVKLVGATAHYVTADLDEGPIIEQSVARVSHSDTIDDLVRLGADIERQVLSRAVLWHAQDRVIRDGNRTIVF